MIVDVPASSANLAAGFDALGIALSVTARLGIVDARPAPGDAARVDVHHPATVAFARAGGVGELWVRSSIPNGRGMGFSGTMRVGGVALALLQQGRSLDDARDDIVDGAAALEGHADNVAASTFGGITVAAGGVVRAVPTPLRPAVVLWVPSAVTASTDRSRAALPASVPWGVAADAVGRAALLVAALAAGDISALRGAMDDELHQPHRLAQLPGSAAALAAFARTSAWCAWLSGSGPTVSAWCAPGDAEQVAAAVSAELSGLEGATMRVTTIDPMGVREVRPPAGE
jgi:homoserine kinase